MPRGRSESAWRGVRAVLSLTRKTDYALVALTELARRSPELASARGIAEQYRLPLPALTNILNQLVRAGLVLSVRGARGGYRLARPADQISITELIEVVDGAFSLTACSASEDGKSPSSCIRAKVCPNISPMRQIHNILAAVLSQLTLDQIARDTIPDEVRLTLSTEPERNPPGKAGAPLR